MYEIMKIPWQFAKIANEDSNTFSVTYMEWVTDLDLVDNSLTNNNLQIYLIYKANQLPSLVIYNKNYCSLQFKYFSMKLGEKIKKFREFKNFTQAYVAGELGISQQAYQLIEAKETILVERLKKIAYILGVEKSQIESFDGEHAFYQHNYDNSKENLQYQFGVFNEKLYTQYEERINDLKETIKTKNEVISMQKEMIDQFLK